MPTRAKPAKKRTRKKTAPTKFSVGREAFEKISAVEGITLTGAMVKRVEEFDRKGLTSAQRRSEIIKFYRKKA
jgi:hypothetical protein